MSRGFRAFSARVTLVLGIFKQPNDLLLARLRTEEIPPYLCYFDIIWTWTQTLTHRRPHGTLFRSGGVGTVIFG